MIVTGVNIARMFNGDIHITLKIAKESETEAFSLPVPLAEGEKLDVTIKKYRPRRSLDANAYAWVLIDKLAEKTGIEKEKVYRHLIRNIGGNCDIVCVTEKSAERLIETWESRGTGWVADPMPSKLDGCINVTLYTGSSQYNVEQMSRLIDLLVAECKEQNIETMTPQQIEGLKENWRTK